MNAKMKKIIIAMLMVIVALSINSNSVAAASKKMAISKKTLTMTVGQKKTIKIKNAGKKKVTWKSSKKSIATVSKSGKISAKKAGKATITAKVSGKKFTCKVTVKKGNKKSKHPVSGITTEIKNGRDITKEESDMLGKMIKVSGLPVKKIIISNKRFSDCGYTEGTLHIYTTDTFIANEEEIITDSIENKFICAIAYPDPVSYNSIKESYSALKKMSKSEYLGTCKIDVKKKEIDVWFPLTNGRMMIITREGV